MGHVERVRESRAEAFSITDADRLNCLGITVTAGPDAQVIPLTSGLPDACFESDGQLTKREVRAVTLSSLAPRAGELLWDIGCGSGSIAIEWLLRHPANKAIGIEPNDERRRTASRNAVKLGASRLELIAGSAPDDLADLPRPDAIFIGGGATAPGAIEAAWEALTSGGRLVANGVTIETEGLLSARFSELGGSLVRLSVGKIRPSRPLSRLPAGHDGHAVECDQAMSSVIAGIGCRSGCPAEEISALLEQALQQAGNPPLAALATSDHKREEAGIIQTAAALDKPLHFISLEGLMGAESMLRTVSEKVAAHMGFPSIAEAAALAAAGPDARLLLPRIHSKRVTCALAEGAP